VKTYVFPLLFVLSRLRREVVAAERRAKNENSDERWREWDVGDAISGKSLKFSHWSRLLGYDLISKATVRAS